jgi:hypothetical protein
MSSRTPGRTGSAPIGQRLEVASTVLLALATVATAWSAYQSREWTGEQAQGYSHATAARIAENRASALANRNVQIDVATFIQWIDARAHGEGKLAGFYRRRFRDEFEPAFAAWIATRPLANPQAPPTPFAMRAYKLRASTEADRLDVEAAVDSEHAKSANQTANNYMLAVVLFASSLFFAGISVRLQGAVTRRVLLGLGSVVFVATLIWLATLRVK